MAKEETRINLIALKEETALSSQNFFKIKALLRTSPTYTLPTCPEMKISQGSICCFSFLVWGFGFFCLIFQESHWDRWTSFEWHFVDSSSVFPPTPKSNCQVDNKKSWSSTSQVSLTVTPRWIISFSTDATIVTNKELTSALANKWSVMTCSCFYI